jgi:uncharacterized protein YqgV (UPF0045/DUF77 family)
MKKPHLAQRTNEEWTTALSDPVSDDAIKDLRKILLAGLRASLSDRITTDLDSFTEDFAQEAQQKICKNIHTFRGESKFTTWAMKFAVHAAFAEMRLWILNGDQKMFDNQAFENRKVLVELTVIPLGSNGQTVDQIAKLWDESNKTDLLIERTFNGICVEGEWNEICPVIYTCYQRVQDDSLNGFLRVSIR